jgi:hypothetical protein
MRSMKLRFVQVAGKDHIAIAKLRQQVRRVKVAREGEVTPKPLGGDGCGRSGC